MIRKVSDLKAEIERGETVSVLAIDKEAGKFRTCVTGTGETVCKRPLAALIEGGGLKVIRTDLCGDPMQWGAA